jgi:short-subunit dehydrogenase
MNPPGASHAGAAFAAGLRIVITGASSGLGEALAREYARQHPSAVFALIARRGDQLAGLAQQLAPATVRCFALDVTDREALGDAARNFIAEFGAPDIVIGNAGISAGTLTAERDDAPVFRRIVEVNVVALFDTFAAFLPAMRARGRGTLVGIASVAGIRGLPGAGAYSASKSAAITYLESLRLEERPFGLKVVTIAPGYIRTPMTASNDYPMPFLMPADAFARRAVDVITRGRSFVVIPGPMRVVALVLRALPNWLYDALFARAPRKARMTGAPGDRQ